MCQNEQWTSLAKVEGEKSERRVEVSYESWAQETKQQLAPV